MGLIWLLKVIYIPFYKVILKIISKIPINVLIIEFKAIIQKII